MPAPRKPVEQQRFAYEVFREAPDRPSPATIHRELAARFQDPASLRTIAYWVKGFKERSDEIKLLDSPFSYHRMEDYGLPWNASPYLLKMWRKSLLEETGSEDYEASLSMRPTVRQARWWWRIHQAVPEASMEQVWDLAQRFSNRELEHDVLNTPPFWADLEMILLKLSDNCKIDRTLKAESFR